MRQNTKYRQIIPRGAALLSLLCLSFPYFFFLLMQVKQEVVRMEMREKLEASSLSVVSVSEKDLVWVKKNKEARIGDRFFDVKSMEYKNSLVYLTGLYDDEEAFLEKKLSGLAGKENAGEEILPGLISLLEISWLEQDIISLNIHTNNHTQVYVKNSPRVINQSYRVPTPPPDHILS